MHSHTPCSARASGRLRSFARRLWHDRSGTSTVEFALILPVFVSVSMLGVEIAYMATVNMEMSQIALSVADNASRLGQTDNSAMTPSVREADVDSVMMGATEQGSTLDLAQNGKVILSSLERDSATGKQYIHWQRCTGSLDRDSAYGNDGTLNGLGSPTLPGMGRTGNKVTARAGQAVMFAEVYYRYQPLFAGFVLNDITFHEEAAFVVRDDRILGTASGPDPVTGTATSVCT